jgi:hypothetical protein
MSRVHLGLKVLADKSKVERNSVKVSRPLGIENDFPTTASIFLSFAGNMCDW